MRKIIPIIRAESLIPKGPYCYESLKYIPGESIPRLEYKNPCPFRSIDDTKESQGNGFCSYMGKGDWDIGGLLWDAVKECGVKTEEEEHVC